jgi:hypothetical protein
MDMQARTLTPVAIATVFASVVSCGSAHDSSGSGGGGPGSLIPGSGDGGAGGPDGSGLGGGFFVVADGAVFEACTTIGATRTCCNGTQTCTGNEFAAWGPCLDSNGAPVKCVIDAGPPACGNIGEGARMVCDAGPPPPPPPPTVCNDPTVNTEPEILVGYEPAMGQTVGQTGQVKVWVNDEHAPYVAPGEMVDNTTGAVTAPGNRTATANDGLLYEPAIYIAPQSPMNGGTPLFPQWIKGTYNNNPPNHKLFTVGAPIDPAPPGTSLALTYSAEFIWDVSALGLGPGTYLAVFSIHDGDGDRAVVCITIVIT